MSDSMIEDFKKRKYEWAKQKILATTNVTVKEAEKVADQTLLATIPECSKPLKQVELEGLYEQKIEIWCENNK